MHLHLYLTVLQHGDEDELDDELDDELEELDEELDDELEELDEELDGWLGDELSDEWLELGGFELWCEL